MTTREADKLIKTGAVVTVRDTRFGDCFAKVFVSRDRYTIRSEDGGVFERAELEIVAKG